jgi:pimeloyl-ACP methyl ester carboxylesterase
VTPFRFGPPGRQLFGLHLPPQGEPRHHAAVLCAPFGQEAIRSHRLLRVLGERLAREGLDVLRFDYFATGDSDGDDAAGTLDGWIEDVRLADREARARSRGGATWFGLRLGGTIAALASARAAIPPQRLVLWDPVSDGAEYLRALALAHEAALCDFRGSDARGHDEALGFPLGPALRAQIAAIGRDSVAGARAGAVHLVGTSVEPLAQALRARGIEAAVADIDADVEWTSDEAMNTSLVPAEALQAVVAALAST